MGGKLQPAQLACLIRRLVIPCFDFKTTNGVDEL